MVNTSQMNVQSIYIITEESYQYIEKGCVNGHNLVLYKDTSVEECKKKCNMKQDCLAFEYGVNYGGSGNYKPHDCNLQSSGSYANCNGAHHNLDLYVKISKKSKFSFYISYNQIYLYIIPFMNNLV